MKDVKCEFCNKVSDDKCVFMNYKKVIDGKEYFFCCEKHAESYTEKK